MTIRTLLFASYRDLAGTDEIEVELPAGATAHDLIALLRESGGEWQRLPTAPAIAVNLEYAPLSTRLQDGDEVALIPPVSGG
jgi:molybdopterin converting factor subunit 1